MSGASNLAKDRRRLLAELREQGIEDERVLEALTRVPREAFLPAEEFADAYANQALPIGEGQTISQPYIVAVMTQALGLTGQERVLEIGTGSGYQAAVLALLAREVFTVERIEALSGRARATLEKLGYDNIHFKVGDGTEGWPEEAPFDGILVTAAAPDVIPELLAQLAEGARLVMPVGDADRQVLRVYTRAGGRVTRAKLCDCRFVPLIGAHGWAERPRGE